MVKRSARERLLDIQGAITKIDRFVAGKSFDDFQTDALIHDAVVRNLEIVSEASRHIPADLKARATHIAWREIADFGNLLRHGYEAVNDSILWETIQRDLLALRAATDVLLADPDVT
jgi:uncharacterized protein with HEPN domain